MLVFWQKLKLNPMCAHPCRHSKPATCRPLAPSQCLKWFIRKKRHYRWAVTHNRRVNNLIIPICKIQWREYADSVAINKLIPTKLQSFRSWHSSLHWCKSTEKITALVCERLSQLYLCLKASAHCWLPSMFQIMLPEWFCGAMQLSYSRKVLNDRS